MARAIMLDRFLKPWEWQDIYVQRCGNCEYIVALTLKYSLNREKKASDKIVILSDRLNRLFYQFRVYTQGFAALGDSEMLSSKLPNGEWIISQSKGFNDKFDLIIFYLHGDVNGETSVYIYREFMQRFLVVLQEQGFSNPAIFMPAASSGMFSKALDAFYGELKELRSGYPDTNIVISGDSIGANQALALILMVEMGLKFGENEDLITEPDPLRKPEAALLISPVIKFNNLEEQPYDYLTPQTLKNWGVGYLGETVLSSQDERIKILGSPGLCQDSSMWMRAFPEHGMIISYGSEETLSPEIDKFVDLLKHAGGKMKVDRHRAQIHNWPLLTYTTERNVDDREESINLFAGMISRMLLGDTRSYFEPNTKEPSNVITIDDQFV